METKRCSKCEKVKTLEEFHRRTVSADGREPQCKQCKKEYMRQYCAAHHKEVKERNAQYYIAHQEEIRERSREYYIAHHEEMAKRHRQYRIDHPKKRAAQDSRRRARKAGAEGIFTAEQFTELCEQYGNRCFCCGEVKKLTIDHIVPLSKGGSNNLENAQPLCQSCNSSKGTKTIDYRDVK